MKVQCPQCGSYYQAAPQLFGKRVKCKCGGVISVPQADSISNHSSQTAGSDDFWDALNVPASAVQNTDLAQSTMTSEEEARSAYANLNSFAIERIASKVSPQQVQRELIARGVDAETAERIIRNVAPQ